MQVLKPMRYMVGGTMLVSPEESRCLAARRQVASRWTRALVCEKPVNPQSGVETHLRPSVQAVALALEHGWSINIGGGMHHACFEARRHMCRAPGQRPLLVLLACKHWLWQRRHTCHTRVWCC